MQNLYPDFIGIGAQKAATTWLFENLKCHPEIWMPPEKELHYFDRSRKYPSRCHLACSKSLWLRFLGWSRADLSYKNQIARAVIKNTLDSSDPSFIGHPPFSRFSWYLNYFLGAHDDEWYASLFDQAKHKIKGEITPAYSMLEAKDVEHISKIMPKTKIIFFLRNPVDRAWSSIRYKGKNNVGDIIKSEQKLEDFIHNPAIELRSNYLRTLTIWKTYFSENQIFIGFYDEVKKSPEELLIRLYNFLNVEATQKNIPSNIFDKRNTSLSLEMPREVKTQLAKVYYSEIRELSSMLGGYANDWLSDLDSTLSNTV